MYQRGENSGRFDNFFHLVRCFLSFLMFLLWRYTVNESQEEHG